MEESKQTEYTGLGYIVCNFVLFQIVAALFAWGGRMSCIRRIVSECRLFAGFNPESLPKCVS